MLFFTLKSMNLRQRILAPCWALCLPTAKSAGGRSSDTDFAFCEDVLLNDDRLKLVNTPTTLARETDMHRLHLLANQCQEMEAFAPAYQEETLIRLVG